MLTYAISMIILLYVSNVTFMKKCNVLKGFEFIGKQNLYPIHFRHKDIYFFIITSKL